MEYTCPIQLHGGIEHEEITSRDLQSWSKVLGRYQFPPSPEVMLEYQLHTVRNGHLLTPTLIRGEGGILATHNVNDSLEIKQSVVISYSVSTRPNYFV